MKTMLKFFIGRSKRIIQKLSQNKFFNKNYEVKEIEVLDNDVRVKVINNGSEEFLDIPKKVMGNNRDEDFFVSNLISNAQ